MVAYIAGSISDIFVISAESYVPLRGPNLVIGPEYLLP